MNNNQTPEEPNSSDFPADEMEESAEEVAAESEASEEYNPNNLKEGFGREEYAKTLGNKNYYKDEAGRLRSQLEEQRKEKTNGQKEVVDKEKLKEQKKQEKDERKEQRKNGEKPQKKEKGDKSGQKESGEKKPPTKMKDKNALDKAKDRVNIAKTKGAMAMNKVNSAKAKTYAATHPVEAAKQKAYAATIGRLKNAIRKVIIAHLPLFLMIGLILIVIILLILMIIGSAGGDSEVQERETMSENNISDVTVQMSSGVGDNTYFSTTTLEDFAMGAAFAELKNDISSLTSSQKSEVIKAHMLVSKSNALVYGNYNSEDPEIKLFSNSKYVPYCSIYSGCSLFEQSDGSYIYAPSSFGDGDLPGTFKGKIDPASATDISLYEQASMDTSSLLLVPDSISSMLLSATFGTIPYSQTIKSGWISKAKNNKDFRSLIAETPAYSGYKIYDHSEYATEYSYASSESYWWPVGGSTPDKNGKYSGQPTATTITSGFGYRELGGGTNHGGIDISGGTTPCSSNTIVATRDGTVTATNNSCASTGSYGDNCGGGLGNYVMIDHGDGVTTVYGHMTKGSVVVKTGDHVLQGQKIGTMGSSGSSTGCHLHFEVRVNNTKSDPAEYVSSDNPRPVQITSGYQEGTSAQQTVCLSLKKMGFSSNAVTALMVNISSESNFNTQALGDNGTSYGLCQWHNGRWENLKRHCGNKASSVQCQLSYLLSELQSSNVGTYNYLRTNNSARDMAEYFCVNFERPANTYATCSGRANNKTASFESYVKNNCN